jgi:hypothetical protein
MSMATPKRNTNELPRRWCGDRFIAAIADGVRCPHCCSTMRPSDIIVEFNDDDDVNAISVVCRGCHRDFFHVEIMS